MIFKTVVIIILICIGCDTTNIYHELGKINHELKKWKGKNNEQF